jgi:hypothetical protein
MFQSIRLPRGGNLLKNAEYNKICEIINIDEFHERVATLASEKRKARILDLFRVENIHNEIPRLRKCISVAFSLKSAQNTRYNEFPTTMAADDEKKSQLCELCRAFAGAAAAMADWKLRIYTDADDISVVLDAAAAADAAIEIVEMKQPNVGKQPAELWKFLALEDVSLDKVFIVSLAAQWSEIAAKIATFEQSPPYIVMARNMLGYATDGDVLYDMTRATEQLCLFPIRQIIVDFILWKLNSCAPVRRGDELHEDYFWTKQPLDLQIINHILFPYIALKGKVLSWTEENIHHRNIYSSLEETDARLIYYHFCLNHQNLFCCVNSV